MTPIYALDTALPDDIDHDPERKRGARGAAVVATATPLASRAAIETLQRGGGAADAIVAAQAVLTLVEPNASGIGGGSVIVWHDVKSGKSGVVDGLSAAPAAVTERLEVDFDGRIVPRERALIGGRTVGVPGTLRALELFHGKFGRLDWASLFTPAMTLAEEGFPLPPYLLKTIGEMLSMQDEPLANAVYCGGGNRVLPVGSKVRNPELAKTFALIAQGGANAFYLGGVAEAMLGVVNGDDFAGRMTMADMAGYRAIERPALRWRMGEETVLTAPPPVFGGLAVAQMVSLMESLGALGREPTRDTADLHLLLETGRVAFADRGAYVGDPDFAAIHPEKLIDPAYIAERARRIDPARASDNVAPGEFGAAFPRAANGAGLGGALTSHVVVADANGLTVSMTSTINQNFGSRLSSGGFYLNNVQTNFARLPTGDGRPSYNAMAPGKRPMTSFSPSIALDVRGSARAALGAGGGNRIVGFIANALLRMGAGMTDPQSIIAAPQALNWNGLSDLEPPLAHHAAALGVRGHYPIVRRMDGGTQMALRDGNAWVAGGDIRRDGTAMAIKSP